MPSYPTQIGPIVTPLLALFLSPRTPEQKSISVVANFVCLPHGVGDVASSAVIFHENWLPAVSSNNTGESEPKQFNCGLCMQNNKTMLKKRNNTTETLKPLGRAEGDRGCIVV